jgi:predicted RND superfamily exporter protein
LRSLAWSVALIFGSILLVFRSLRALLGAVLANAVPLMLVCAAVWFVGSPLNLVTAFVFLVALGVIVDDSIHILFWRAAGDSVSGSSIEFSVLLSTLIFCLGLLLCQLSEFPTTRQFSAYCALALVAAVISNLSVLPLLLRARQPPAAAPRSDVEVRDG